MNQSYRLDMIPGGVPPVVNCKQYDNVDREIKFTLHAGDSSFTVSSGNTVTVSGTKPDLTGFSYNCTYSGSVVTVPIKTQMTALAGNIPCQLTVASDGGVIGTATFILAVAPAALEDDTIISATDIPVFQDLLTQVQQEAATAGGYNARITALEANISTLNSNSQPILWKQISRENINHATGANYWTLDTAFPSKTGYSRKVIGFSSSSSVVVTGFEIDSSGWVKLLTYNLSGAAVTVNVYAICLYLKDSQQWS